MGFVEDEFPDLESLKTERDTVFAILDEIKLLAVGFNVLNGGCEQSRWELVRQKYYEQLKEAFLYEKQKEADSQGREPDPTLQ